MFNVVGIIIALLVAENSMLFGNEGGSWTPIAVAAAPLLMLLFSRVFAGPLLDRLKLSELMARTQDLRNPDVREALARETSGLLKTIPKVKLFLQLASILLFVGVCFGFGWPDYVVNTLGVPEYLHILPEVFPFFLIQMGTWPATIALDRRLGNSRWTLKKYAKFAWRMNLMTLAPMMLISTAYWSVLTFVPGFAELESAFTELQTYGIMLLLLPVSILMPVFMRFLIPARPLEKGILRRTLESYAKEQNIGIKQIFVWKTGTSHFATAFVIGLIAPARYVFITDALIRKSSREQILAVFAHECGHVKHRHLWLLLGFLVFLAVAMSAIPHVAGVLGLPDDFQTAMGIGSLVGAYHLFGYISRRFERQADAFAAKTTSVEALISMFLLLGQGNPAAMTKNGWRHFSIGRRIHELELSQRTPEVKRFFASELRRIKLFIVVILIGAIGILIEPTRMSISVGLTDWTFMKYDQGRVKRLDSAQLDELRDDAIYRARRIAEFSEVHELESRRIEGIIVALSGGGTDDLDNLISQLQKEYNQDSAEGNRGSSRRDIELVEASERSVNRAVALGTSFETELSKELKR